jgi:hypothetical protein
MIFLIYQEIHSSLSLTSEEKGVRVGYPWFRRHQIKSHQPDVRDKEAGTFYVFIIGWSMPMLCLSIHQILLSFSPIGIGGPAGLSHRARVQRGESTTARCASTEDHQAPSHPLFREHRTNVGVLPFRVLSLPLFRGVAKLPSTARIERGPS